ASPLKLRRARREHQIVVERIEGAFHSIPDRRGAGDRELLRDDDARESVKAAGALAQRRLSRDREYRSQPRVELQQLFQPTFEIALDFDTRGHRRQEPFTTTACNPFPPDRSTGSPPRQTAICISVMRCRPF